jgi:hypothetical protein
MKRGISIMTDTDISQDFAKAIRKCKGCGGTGRVDNISGTTSCGDCKYIREAEYRRLYELNIYTRGFEDAIEAAAKIAERYEPDEKQDYINYASQQIRALITQENKVE